jgi:hypothetical protein
MIRFLISGDFYPGRRTHGALVASDASSLVGPLMAEFEKADLVALNLEGPLIAAPSPIEKIGPIHGTPDVCVKGMRQLRIGLVNLANNHVMDHGATGLNNTLEVCRREGMAWVGGGTDVAAASQIWFCERNGVRLGVLSCAEYEFGMATSTRAGANPLDLVRVVRSMREQRKNLDRLVVLLHGGNEYCPYPRPSLAELCRFLVEQGADAVICQHSHCIGCWETYRGGIIVYGQGNFIFDDPKARPCENEGMLLSMEIFRDQPLAMRTILFKQASVRPGIEPMSEAEEDCTRQILEERNRRLQDPEFLEREWIDFCSGKRRAYLGIVHGFGRRLRNLDGRFGVLSPFFSKHHALMMLHMLRCESHRELMQQVLSDETEAQ